MSPIDQHSCLQPELANHYMESKNNKLLLKGERKTKQSVPHRIRDVLSGGKRWVIQSILGKPIVCLNQTLDRKSTVQEFCAIFLLVDEFLHILTHTEALVGWLSPPHSVREDTALVNHKEAEKATLDSEKNDQQKHQHTGGGNSWVR